jgi:hypothetical protein
MNDRFLCKLGRIEDVAEQFRLPASVEDLAALERIRERDERIRHDVETYVVRGIKPPEMDPEIFGKVQTTLAQYRALRAEAMAQQYNGDTNVS